jgi:hypothetical protein
MSGSTTGEPHPRNVIITFDPAERYTRTCEPRADSGARKLNHTRQAPKFASITLLLLLEMETGEYLQQAFDRQVLDGTRAGAATQDQTLVPVKRLLDSCPCTTRKAVHFSGVKTRVKIDM